MNRNMLLHFCKCTQKLPVNSCSKLKKFVLNKKKTTNAENCRRETENLLKVCLKMLKTTVREEIGIFEHSRNVRQNPVFTVFSHILKEIAVSCLTALSKGQIVENAAVLC